MQIKTDRTDIHYYGGKKIRCKHIFCDDFSEPIDGYLYIKN